MLTFLLGMVVGGALGYFGPRLYDKFERKP